MTITLHSVPRTERLRLAWAATASGRVERFATTVGLGVLLAGCAVVVVAAMVPTGPRTAGLLIVLAAVALGAAGAGRERARRVAARRRQGHVEVRTAAALDRLSPERWAVRHHVPVGESRTAHLVADADEVHVVVAVWLPRTPERAALELRSGLAAADRAGQRLAELDADRDVRRRVHPIVVAWGRHAATARRRQAPRCPVEVLLPGELWRWRAERGGGVATDRSRSASTSERVAARA